MPDLCYIFKTTMTTLELSLLYKYTPVQKLFWKFTLNRRRRENMFFLFHVMNWFMIFIWKINDYVKKFINSVKHFRRLRNSLCIFI